MAEGKRIKISLVTWYRSCNYGSVLQAWALVKILHGMGVETRLLRYFRDDFRPVNVLKNALSAAGITDLLQGKARPLSPGWRAFRRFRRKNFDEISVTGAGSFRRLLAKTDVFMAGSDQIWNRAHHRRSFEFLGFAPQGSVKVSYASSIGTAGIPESEKSSVRALLEGYGAISLREESGVRAVRELTGRDDVRLVLDPTLLLSREQWLDFAAGASLPRLPEEFTLCYFVGRRQEIPHFEGPLVQLLSEESQGCEIPGALVLRSAGPREFVKALSMASRVLTDSFHASALCCNLGTPLVPFRRFAPVDPASQNGRLDDLFSLLGLAPQWEGEPMVPDASVRLAALRKESLSWLENAIKAPGKDE